MSIALFIGATVVAFIGYLFAAAAGAEKVGAGFILWLICTTGAAALLIAVVQA